MALSQMFELSPAAGATTPNIFTGTIYETLTLAGQLTILMVSDAPTTAGDRVTAAMQLINASGSQNLIQPGSVVPVTRNGIAGSGPDGSNHGLALLNQRVESGNKPVLTITNGDTAALRTRVYVTLQ